MQDRFKSPPFILGLILVAGFLILAAARGGELGFPMLIGDASISIPAPGSAEAETSIPTRVETPQVEQVAEPPVIPVPSMAGTWRGRINLENNPMANVTIRFFISGSYDIEYDASSFDPGRWSQEGRSVAWRSTSNTEYRGVLRDNTISGTTRRPSGTFYLERVS